MLEEIFNNPLRNKGTAFTQQERDARGLNGYLPYHVSTMEEQLSRRYDNFKNYPNSLAKHLFLSALQNRNEILFYRLVYEHISEMLPLIYTPTVGDVSEHYSSLFTYRRGLYLSYPHRDKIDEIVSNYPYSEIDVIVVTDGERVLGLGDLGIGGMSIPIGKLTLYTLFGGIHPGRTLPILLDVGTNNTALLNDPLYLGWRQKRVQGKEYEKFVDQFVKAIKKRYPKVLLQWEDFGKENAKPLLERYQNEICSFNDDIQGTASVVLAAILAACRATKGELRGQRIVIVGGGSAGLGIAHQISAALLHENMSQEEAKALFYIVDIEGLIHENKKSVLPRHEPFARTRAEVETWSVKNPDNISLLEVVQHVKPTILIGVCTKQGIFSEEIIKTMAKYVQRPIIFPLSNPTSHSEAHPADLIHWTEGRAIVATGSPFEPVVYQGHSYPISQCNNISIFPGVGLGVIATGAKKVSPLMFLKAAQVLSEHSPLLRKPLGALFPSYENLREVAQVIAQAVGEAAVEEKLCPHFSKDEIIERIQKKMWFPDY